MNHQFFHLAQRIFNVPVAIHPQKSEIIVSALAERLGIANFSKLENDLWVAGTAQTTFTKDSKEKEYRAYDVVNGTAIIPIQGTLVHKLGTLRPYSGMTGYDGIRQNLQTALRDEEVNEIVLDIDSPGGEVSGCFDLVDDIYSIRGQKPITALLTENAYSAAYAIASAADHIAVPRTGGVGSIGVICMHVDYSTALKSAGIKVTMIKYGDFKGMGAAELPLSDDALSRIQKDINMMGELFVETVARNRGLKVQKVRDTQAACFTGKEGVDMGLADEVISHI